MTRDGGYLVWRTACLSKSPGRRFSQAMTRKIAVTPAAFAGARN